MSKAKIGLIDVDGHNFPNLALMKISAWHKSNGDDVTWYSPLLSGHMDKVYMSKVFTFTPDYQYPIDADEIEKGGTGYKDYTKVLAGEVENTFPDYSIYPMYDFAVGFLTRGCIRNCPWCIVPKKEGYIKPDRTWQEIRRGDTRNITFLDNNVLASDFGIEQIKQLGETDYKIDFNQGMDARLVTQDIAELLSRCLWQRQLRFSCDTAGAFDAVETAVKRLEKYGVPPRKVFVYCLVQDVEEAHDRVLRLASLGVDPFAQPYRDFDGGEPTQEQKDFARWVNMKAVFKSCSFEEYKKTKGYQ